MKTFQLIETTYREYFIEAESLEDAIGKIEAEEVKPVETWTDESIEVIDIHDGHQWESERVSA